MQRILAVVTAALLMLATPAWAQVGYPPSNQDNPQGTPNGKTDAGTTALAQANPPNDDNSVVVAGGIVLGTAALILLLSHHHHHHPISP